MLTREYAQTLVEQIRFCRRYISDDEFQKMPREAAAAVKESLGPMLIDSAIVKFARNLHSSSRAHYLIEMLQYCDSNNYSIAKANKKEPYVSLQIHLNRIIVECNGDDLTEEDLMAICDVRRSTKTGTRSFKSESGIDFKSAFVVAHEILIESGNLSFALQHQKGDLGIGMVTPIWRPNTKGPDRGITRFTLFLRNAENFGDKERYERVSINEQLRNMQGTLLWFRNLERIKVAFYDRNGIKDHFMNHSICRHLTFDTAVPGIVRTSTIEQGRCEEEPENLYYQVFRNPVAFQVTSLAPAKAHSSEVIIAFPLDKALDPIEQDRPLFSFRPDLKTKFKFLVQADAVTEKSWYDVVNDNDKNECLLDDIAPAFVKAILLICGSAGSLKYQWMRYLPPRSECSPGKFSLRLLESIKHRLSKAPVMQLEHEATFRGLAEVRRPTPDHLAIDGKSLLIHTRPSCYVSSKYLKKDLDRLEDYGLTYMSAQEFVKLVRDDLESFASVIRFNQDKNFHSRLAEVLCSAYPKLSPTEQAKFHELKIIPARADVIDAPTHWISCSPIFPVYLPEIKEGLHIPRYLGLKVVDTKAAANLHWRRLFDILSVKRANEPFIREAIFRYYAKPKHIDIQSAVDYIRFLYLTHDDALLGDTYKDVILCTDTEDGCHHDDRNFYISSEDPYGPSQLLAGEQLDTNAGQHAPGFPATFLHELYLKDPPSRQSESSDSWEGWLCKYFNVRRSLPLLSKNRDTISADCQYIAEKRPEKFVGFLRSAWQDRDLPAEHEQKIIEELSQIQVLCQSGKYPLAESFLPLKKWKQLCDRFLQKSEPFSWLKLDSDVDDYDEIPPEWRPLCLDFDLGIESCEVKFTLTVLQRILESNVSANDLVRPERVCRLYIHLQRALEQSDPSKDLRGMVRQRFNEEKKAAIFVPGGQVDGPSWASPEICVWESPMELTVVYSLERLYDAKFSISESDRSALKAFFSDTLGVRDCSWYELVEELRNFKQSGSTDFGKLGGLYKCIARQELHGNTGKILREIFEDEALIYDFRSQPTSWHTMDECLLSSCSGTSSTRIIWTIEPEMLYKGLGLEVFFSFVRRLGLEMATAKSVYKKLIGGSLDIEETKQGLKTFNSLLPEINHDELDPSQVREQKVFPVRSPNGDVTLVTATTDFALADRQSLHRDFAKTAKFLDFSIEEIHKMQPFIEWAGLGDRYLSKAVQEISSADEALADPIVSYRWEIKGKARALLSIAKAFDSPRMLVEPQICAALLSNVQMLGTDSICSELHLTQDKETFKVKKRRSDLHIREEGEFLTIVVPKNAVKRQICFSEKLPRSLVTILMGEKSVSMPELARLRAISAIKSVLAVNRQGQEGVLEAHGIRFLGGTQSTVIDLSDESEREDRDEGSDEDGNDDEVDNGDEDYNEDEVEDSDEDEHEGEGENDDEGDSD